ncbi:hypothetical protein BY996DRAFT_6457613 [Phakopsora pachyrhizi]|nr:hypothetical protein BY996DRAFT_6457613 [Phakopsora pachyrhizi]
MTVTSSPVAVADLSDETTGAERTKPQIKLKQKRNNLQRFLEQLSILIRSEGNKNLKSSNQAKTQPTGVRDWKNS